MRRPLHSKGMAHPTDWLDGLTVPALSLTVERAIWFGVVPDSLTLTVTFSAPDANPVPELLTKPDGAGQLRITPSTVMSWMPEPTETQPQFWAPSIEITPRSVSPS